MQKLSQSGRRLLILSAITAGCIGMVLMLVTEIRLTALVLGEYSFQDRLVESWGRKTETNEKIVFLAIDAPTLSLADEDKTVIADSRALGLMAGGFPWSREVWGLVIDRLCEAGARLVILDLVFPGEGEGDAVFSDSLEHWSDRVVIGYTFEPYAMDQGREIGGRMLYEMSLPSESILPQTKPLDPRCGYVNFWGEIDDRIRTVQLETTLDGLEGKAIHPSSEWLQSVTASAMRMLGKEDLLERRVEPHPFRFGSVSEEAYKPRSLYGMFWPGIWRENYQGGEFFRDKIVLIGPSARIFHDVHPTPFGEMLGPQLHIHSLAAAIALEYYRRSSLALDLLLIVGTGLLAFAIVALVSRPVLRVALLAVSPLLYLAAAVALFNRSDLLITGMAPLLAFVSTGVLCFGYDFACKVLEEFRLKRVLTRFVSQDLAHEILEEREGYLTALGGTNKAMTILFSDIRGFTTITEEMDPGELVTHLNEYFAQMVDAVFSHHGTLDKFIGDAVMACWGSVKTVGPQQDSRRAVAAAVEMRDRLALLNEKWKVEGKRPFQVGIGLNHGDAIFGNIGSEERMDPTVIGDAVNLAARLEGLTKQYRCEIIISESVAKLVGDEFFFRSVDLVRVKGKTKAVEIFSVLSERNARCDQPAGWLIDYEQGVRAFRGRRFERAAEIFREVLAREPGDYLSEMHLKNAERFVANPPRPDWDGVTVMTTK
ncbi:MAG: adenylate/guanylate cyclase domain-containing protein [Verrucomicrobiales bacterium]